MRARNTTSRGTSFSAATVDAVWKKGSVVPNYNPQIYRKDKCGAWMHRSHYGDVNSEYGWEIDHIKPASMGGNDALLNLQPLQWANNRQKSDKYPNWTCAIKAA